MEWVSLLAGVLGAIAGGCIAGYCSLKAITRSHNNQLVLAKTHEEQTISGLLQAIHDEVETVFDRYNENMGVQLEALRDGGIIGMYYPLVSDFFNVYNGNGFLIGRIKDNDLRKRIIKTYTLGKGMIDSFRLNNDLVSKLEFANKLYNESKQEVHQKQAAAHYAALVDYAKSLKSGHYLFKQEVSGLLRELRKNGVLNEKTQS
jgi:hypothetical protein